MSTHRSNLLMLHARVDAFFAGVASRHSASMACRVGCSGCCQQSLSVFSIEMERILEAVDLLPQAERERLRARVNEARAAGLPGDEQPCVLLEDDRCVVYDARPTICRTHGAPILVPRDLGGGRDVCPMSFTDGSPALDDLPTTDILDIDRVNQTLALVEHLRGQDAEEGPGTLRQEAAAAPAAVTSRLGPRNPLRHVLDMPRVSGTRSGAESTPGAGDPSLPERPSRVDITAALDGHLQD